MLCCLMVTQKSRVLESGYVMTEMSVEFEGCRSDPLAPRLMVVRLP